MARMALPNDSKILSASLEEVTSDLGALAIELASASSAANAGVFPDRALIQRLSTFSERVADIAETARVLASDVETLVRPPADLQELHDLVVRARHVNEATQKALRIVAEVEEIISASSASESLLSVVRNAVEEIRHLHLSDPRAAADKAQPLEWLVTAAREPDPAARTDASLEIAASFGPALARAILKGEFRAPRSGTSEDERAEAAVTPHEDVPSVVGKKEGSTLDEPATLADAAEEAPTEAARAGGDVARTTDDVHEPTGGAALPPVEVDTARDTVPHLDLIPSAVTRAPLPARAERAATTSIARFPVFASTRRVVAGGALEAAPWTSAGYPDSIIRRFVALLAQPAPSFGELWLLAREAEELRLALPPSDEVETAAVIWSGTVDPIARPAHRLDTLYEPQVDDQPPGAQIRRKLAVVLEAISPDPTAPLIATDVSPVVDGAGFDNALLATVTRDMLTIAAHGERPLAVLRPLLDSAHETPEHAHKTLRARREELRDYFNQAQQRKLFRFKTEFCQDLWLSFLSELQPDLRVLFPDGDELPRADQTAAVLTKRKRYVEVVDRGGARHGDRNHMDRAIERLFELVMKVQTASERVVYVQNIRPGLANRRLDLDAFRRLPDAVLPGVLPEEQFLLRLLHRALSGAQDASSRHALALGVEDLCRVPAWLAYTPPFSLDGVLLFSSLHPTREAASFVLAPSGEGAPGNDQRALLEALRTPAWRHLLPNAVSLLSESERVLVLQESLVNLEALRDDVHGLTTKLRLLKAAASPMADALTLALNETNEMLSGGGARPDTQLLCKAWCIYVDAAVENELARCRAEFLAEAKSRIDPPPSDVEHLIQSNRFVEALAVLRGNAVPAIDQRVTPYRHDAGYYFSDPVARLAALDEEAIARKWTEGLGDHNAQRSLRTEFAKFVFGRLYESAEKHHQDRVVVSGQVIRDHLASLQLNPSYVPQLARIASIIFPGLGSGVTSPKFVHIAADTAGQFATATPGAIVVLLVPRLTRERRALLLAELRRRKLRAAVLDDVDLCRLMNPGGERPNTVLALLEILLEQQSWRAMSPFDVGEGQHVQMEMYVGRKGEAELLAATPKYTRLFSGRKLGKSALLKYVEKQYDGMILPSGKTLRVAYVSAVGIEKANALVDTIIHALERFKVRVTNTASNAEPFDRLRSALELFAEKHNDASLLLVLDEADVFVEAEMEEYQRSREKCLSFKMRSGLDASDSQGLPVVRVLFTGYRVTNTREGAWANWGDVLTLQPLRAQEAADLVSGPLARLGIDATEQAPAIAHRCGYQPAVILRFGERLLSYLDERYPGELRDRARITVTGEDVAQIADDDAVIQEIRTIARNNFQGGNDAGRIVFGALLAEFLAAGAAARLEHPEELLLERLTSLSGDTALGWLRTDGGNVRDELRHQLEDLVERQMLTKHPRPGAAPEYSLRFPHHLTVLAQLAREDLLREDIIRLATARDTASGPGTLRGLVPRAVFTKLGRMLSETPDYLPIVPVFYWPATATQSGDKILARGLLDSLGMLDSERLPSDKALTNVKSWKGRERVVIESVRFDQIDKLLLARGSSATVPLLVGGMDLLRACLTQPERSIGETTYLMEICSPGRLGLPALTWWFQRARSFEFSSGRAEEKILDATAGIPELVAWVDDQLARRDPAGTGLDVTEELLADALKSLERCFGDDVARRMRLTTREADLLRMVRHVVHVYPQEMSPTDLLTCMTDDWPELRKLPTVGADVVETIVEFSPAAPADKSALELLLAAGLLPSDEHGSRMASATSLGTVRPGDPAFRLV